MIKQALINEIIIKNKITDYLFSKGIFPSTKVFGNRVKYCCPIHKENIPSFTVYIGDDNIENYFCYGCKSGSSIITLYSALEGLSFKDTIKKLGQGIDISDEAELDLTIRKMKEYVKNNYVKKDETDIALILLKLGSISYSFLEKFDFDQEVLDFLESLYKRVDELALRNDIETLEQVYNMIIKEKLFIKKSQEFKNNIMEKRRLEVKAKEAYDKL